MKFKLFSSFVALTLLFSACDTQFSELGGGVLDDVKTVFSDLKTVTITKSEYEKAGTEYKGSAKETIAEGVTFQKVNGNYDLIFGNVPNGEITLYVKNGNIFTAYTFINWSNSKYTFSNKDVSNIKYGAFEVAQVEVVIPTITFYTVDGQEVVDVARPYLYEAADGLLYRLNYNNDGGQDLVSQVDISRWDDALFRVPAGETIATHAEFWILDEDGNNTGYKYGMMQPIYGDLKLTVVTIKVEPVFPYKLYAYIYDPSYTYTYGDFVALGNAVDWDAIYGAYAYNYYGSEFAAKVTEDNVIGWNYAHTVLATDNPDGPHFVGAKPEIILVQDMFLLYGDSEYQFSIVPVLKPEEIETPGTGGVSEDDQGEDNNSQGSGKGKGGGNQGGNGGGNQQ